MGANGSDDMKGGDFYQYMFESVRDPILIIHTDGRIIDANRAIVEALGYSREELRRMNVYDLRPDFRKPSVCEELKNSSEGGVFETIYQRKDGSIFPVEISTRGAMLGGEMALFGVIRDITDRKRAEEALKSSEARFRAIFEHAGAAIFVADIASGMIIDCNQQAEHLIGRSRAEILRLHFTGLHPPVTEAEHRRIFSLHALAPKTCVTNHEAEVLHKDGRIFPVIINAAPLEIDGRKILIGFFVDITERKCMEQSLKDSETFLRNTFACIQDGITVLDTSLTIMSVNPAMEKSFGGGIVGKKCYALYHGRQTPCEQCPSIRAIRGKTTHSEIVHDILGRWLEVYAFPLISDDGHVTGVIEHIRDITERKRAEEAVKEAKQQAELYLDLMGHDINNMHQIALGYLELARSVYPGAEKEELLDKPIEVLQRSTQLIKNVQKLQKLNEGAFQSRIVDVCEILEDVHREYSAVSRKVITLDLNGCDHYHVFANELLRDVFTNLVGNAIKHTGDGTGIAMNFRIVNDNGGRYCQVSVEDNGPGIRDDFKARVFSRMLNGDSKAKGMGLGLYLVKSLVDSYGGQVRVEDRVPGDHTKGAKFVVTLPAAEK